MARDILKRKKCVGIRPIIVGAKKYFESVDKMLDDHEDWESPLNDDQVKLVKGQINGLKTALFNYYKGTVGVNVKGRTGVYTVFMTRDQLENISDLKKKNFDYIQGSFTLRDGQLSKIVPVGVRYESDSEEGIKLAAKMEELKILY